MDNTPEEIYLTTDDEEFDWQDDGKVHWRATSVNVGDIKYVRADKYQKAVQSLKYIFLHSKWHYEAILEAKVRLQQLGEIE